MPRRYVIGRLVLCTQIPGYVHLCFERVSVRKTITLCMCLCFGKGGGLMGAHAKSDLGYLSYMTKSLHSGQLNPTSGQLLPLLWSGWSNPHRHLPPLRAGAEVAFRPLFKTLLGLFKNQKHTQNLTAFFEIMRHGNPRPFSSLAVSPFPWSPPRHPLPSVHASAHCDVDDSRASRQLSETGWEILTQEG